MGANARSARRLDRTKGQKVRKQKVSFKIVPMKKGGKQNGSGKQGR